MIVTVAQAVKRSLIRFARRSAASGDRPIAIGRSTQADLSAHFRKLDGLIVNFQNLPFGPGHIIVEIAHSALRITQ